MTSTGLLATVRKRDCLPTQRYRAEPHSDAALWAMNSSNKDDGLSEPCDLDHGLYIVTNGIKARIHEE